MVNSRSAWRELILLRMLVDSQDVSRISRFSEVYLETTDF